MTVNLSEPKNQTSIAESKMIKEAHSSLTSEWLTSEEAAQFLKIPIGTLRNMTSNGQIRYFKLGRLNRYRTEDLRDLLTRNERGAPYGS